MHMTTLQDIKHAADMLQALSEGKRLVGFLPDQRPTAQHVATNCLDGVRYAVEQSPRRRRTRPFTPEEADILVGCVLVRPDGVSGLASNVRDIGTDVMREVSWPWSPNPTLLQMHNERWHYRVPHSKDLLECWVIES